MIDRPVIENAFALAQVKPFDSLADSELLLVAQHSRSIFFDAGATILEAETVSQVLFTRVGGSILTGGFRGPDVFDAPSILFGAPTRQDYCAGAEGAQLLSLSKPHLFTIVRECPDFVVGLKDALERS
ncbi:MAG: Crp/Fnr family transcriptional regulator [Pseudomonadota bacterium]